MGIAEVLIVSALLFANAFFVAAEFALVKVRTSQIDELAGKGFWAARVTSRLLDRLDAYLSASQFGITLASLGLGFVIESSVEPGIETVLAWIGVPEVELTPLGHMTIAALIAFIVATFLHISLGELVPKSLAIRAAKPMALITGPPMMAFYYVFFPLIWTLNAFSDLVLRLMGLGAIDHTEVAHTEEELRHIVSESVQGGHLSRSERVMIENVLNLEEKSARRIMVPRPDVVYLSLSHSVEENLRIARRAGHTRYPLCEDDLTTVIGMIHIKDLFRADVARQRPSDLKSLARPVLFVPETLKIDELMVRFQTRKLHLAMLLDEFGDIVGMVTLENVIEELVGPIQDEFDRETPRIVDLGDGRFEVDSVCPVDQLAEECGVEIPEEIESETIGGLVVELLDRLAVAGDVVQLARHRITVTQAEPTRVRRVLVEPLDEASSGSALDERSKSSVPTFPETQDGSA